MRLRSFLIVVTVLGAIGCGPSSGSGKVGTQTEVCADYATSYCNRLATCSPYRVAQTFGDVTACVERLKPICASVLQAPGTGLTTEQYGACAAAYTSASCDDVLLASWVPAACAAKGTLADGAACGHNAQCTSGYCKHGFSQVCGTCAALVPSGGSCSRSEDCEAGLGCVSPGTCGATAARGASCRTVPCTPDMVCLNGTCSDRLAADAACVVQDYACNDDLGLYCDSQTLRCTAMTPVPVGGSCATGVIVCIAGGCSPNTQLCEAALADGAACNTELPCRYPAVCVSGTCRVSDPTTCH